MTPNLNPHVADFRAVRAWLEHRWPDTGAALVVYRVKAAPADELARAFVAGPGGTSDYVHMERDAVRALAALGYRLADPGHQQLAVAEIRACDLSAHARLEAIRRIEEALA